MADKSLLAELLLSPSDIRKKEENEAQLQAAQRARMRSQGNPMGGVGGLFYNFGANAAAQAGDVTRQALRGAGEAVGLDMRSQAEKQAAANAPIMRTAVSGNLDKMRELREQLLQNPNVDPRAIAALTARINEQERYEDTMKDDDFNKLTAGDKEAIREASRAARMARLESSKALELADKYAKERPTGGFLGDVYSGFKEFVGGTDELNMMRTQFNGIIMSGVLDSLPPGPATDKDITNAQKGFPNERFSADQITSFLIGFAKAKRIEAGYQKFYAKWLSDNKGNSAGVEDAWAKHFEENKELYWTDDSKPEKEKKEKPKQEPSSSVFNPELVPQGTEGMVTGDEVNRVQTQPGQSPGTMTVPSMYNPRMRRGVLR